MWCAIGYNSTANLSAQASFSSIDSPYPIDAKKRDDPQYLNPLPNGVTLRSAFDTPDRLLRSSLILISLS